MRLRHIIEREDAVSKLEEEVGTERNETPERKHWNYLVLDFGGERHEAEEAGKVEGGEQESYGDGLLCACHFEKVNVAARGSGARGSLRFVACVAAGARNSLNLAAEECEANWQGEGMFDFRRSI